MNLAITQKKISHHGVFWIAAGAIIVLVYAPLFLVEYKLRERQITQGSAPALSLPVLGGDSVEYALLSKNLAEQGTFSLDGKTPETFRSVGYPALVALYLGRGLPLATFPLFQIILAILTSCGIYRIARNFWRPSVGTLAGALYLLDPVTIVNTLTIVTDVFYVFLLVWSFYFFFSSKINSKLAWAIGGLILGFSTLVRPISMFLLAVFVVVYIFKEYREKHSFKHIVATILLCVVAYSVVVIPWVVRNKQTTGVAGISTVKSYNLYHYYVPEFLSYKEGISVDDARKLVGEGMGTFDERSLTNASKMETRAKEFIFESPIGYGTFHLIKTIPFFMSSGVETLFTGYNDVIGKEAFSTIKENMTGLLLKGKFGEVVRSVRAHPMIGAEQIILAAFWLLAVLSLFVAYKRKEFFKVFLLWIIILYFALLTGPVAYSRYRLPATPFLFLLATYAIVIRSYAPPHNHSETR